MSLFAHDDDDSNISFDLGAELVPRHRALRIAGRLLMALLVVTVAALWFAPWQQSVTGRGRVVAFAPLERQQDLKAPIAGRIVAWHVQEGDHVSTGDPIATIEDNDPDLGNRLARSRDSALQRLDSAAAATRVYEQQIIALSAARAASIAAAASRTNMAVDRRRSAAQALDAALAAKRAADLQLDRQRALEKDGLTSTRNRELAELAEETARADVGRARAALNAADTEVKAMKSEQARTDAQTTADVDRARASLESARGDAAKFDSDVQERETDVARQKTMEVVAPRPGAILRQLAKQGGEFVRAGESIAVFVPQTDDRAVELWLDGRDAPLVTPGRKVRLQFEGWPAVQFVGWPSVAVGTFGGEVAFVDAAADVHGRFRVVVTPDLGSDRWPEARFLRQGTQVNGWVLLDRVRLGFELWRQWNGFPAATKAPIDADPAKGAL